MRRGTVGSAMIVALVTVLASCASSGPDPVAGNPARAGGEPNWMAAPTYGTVTLAAGFFPDPYLRSIQAGGADEVTLGGSECAGFINAAAPDLDLNYTAGQHQLAIYAKADSDITLVVNAADGRWYCSDDVDGTNPAVVFNAPVSGNYNIWIGTFRPSSAPLPESVLYISEMAPRW